MALTKNEVEHVAKLARIHLSEKELGSFTEQLASVFEHLDTLSEVQTEHIPETSQVNGRCSALRGDTSEPSLPREAVLLTSKRPSRRGMITVRKSL